MKLVIQNAVTLSMFVLSGAVASAHPGHGQPGPAHYVTDPQHGVLLMVVMLTAISIAAIGWRIKLSAKNER